MGAVDQLTMASRLQGQPSEVYFVRFLGGPSKANISILQS